MPSTNLASRRRRLSILGAALALAVAVISVAALVSGGPTSTAAPRAAVALAHSTFVSGIPEHDGVLGDPKAPVTVTEYVDLQCPVCAQASTTTLPPLVERYVRTGKVKLRMRTMSFIGPDSVKAARFAYGAQQQGRLWSFVENFYANQGPENSGYVTGGFLQRVAAISGVDSAAAARAAATDQAAQALTAVGRDARSVGAEATPTFTISRAGGQEHVLQVGAGDVTSALRRAL